MPWDRCGMFVPFLPQDDKFNNAEKRSMCPRTMSFVPPHVPGSGDPGRHKDSGLKALAQTILFIS
jgi:hypothetical protein